MTEPIETEQPMTLVLGLPAGAFQPESTIPAPLRIVRP